MSTISEFFINILPGLLSGILAGIVLLVIEYRTHWFASHKDAVSGMRYKRSFWNIFDPSVPSFEVMELAWKIMTFLIIFMMIFFFIGLPLSSLLNTTNTSLDVVDDPNILVATIKKDDTKSFFNNELFISVTDIAYKKNKIVVSFSIGSPGYPTQFFDEFQNGSAVVIDTSKRFDIRITSIRKGVFFSGVDFTIWKLSNP